MGIPGVQRQACAEGKGGASHSEPVDEGLGGQGPRAVGQGRSVTGEFFFVFPGLWLPFWPPLFLSMKRPTAVCCTVVSAFALIFYSTEINTSVVVGLGGQPTYCTRCYCTRCTSLPHPRQAPPKRPGLQRTTSNALSVQSNCGGGSTESRGPLVRSGSEGSGRTNAASAGGGRGARGRLGAKGANGGTGVLLPSTNMQLSNAFHVCCWWGGGRGGEVD